MGVDEVLRGGSMGYFIGLIIEQGVGKIEICLTIYCIKKGTA